MRTSAQFSICHFSLNASVVFLLLIVASSSAFGECEAIRRNNCFGFISYKYKVTGSIMSFYPYQACMCVVEYDDFDRNCSGASLYASEEATFFPGYWGTINGVSNSSQLYQYSYVDDPLYLSAGKRNASELDNSDLRAQYLKTYSTTSENPQMSSETNVGTWEIQKGEIIVNSVNIYEMLRGELVKTITVNSNVEELVLGNLTLNKGEYVFEVVSDKYQERKRIVINE